MAHSGTRATLKLICSNYVWPILLNYSIQIHTLAGGHSASKYYS
ncbi:hypothetical protein B4U80_11327 [Leptotrombidium deliense]|uniref:Uncharacterized protein n=1 Tax=Leptotrombidium deliense TaxID=299467 RepID=A0A443RSW7_9ACAR|nr:hypothetical protein B4U80_11327 [Leptotrombidium deliense]